MERESSWNDCLDCKSSIAVTPDKLKANSLIETSKSRVLYLNGLDLNETSANFIFEGYYVSIVELLHALTLRNGFKVSNHICLGFFLKDIVHNLKLFELFDNLRFKRNSIVYYGKLMEYSVAEEAVARSKTLISELMKLVK
jgi:hypothetical protein